MANSPVHVQPSGKKVSNRPGFKQILVEKIPESWGLGDSVANEEERGFKIVQDGPRKVLMEMPIEQFEAMERNVKQVGEDRLKSTDGLGKVKISDKSASELKDSLPDVSDLDQ